jgi:hypothetical protein
MVFSLMHRSRDRLERENETSLPMAPKYHQPPISGGDRKALTKEFSKSRAMTRIFAERSAEKRRDGEALIQPTTWPVKVGMKRCGATADPSIRHRPRAGSLSPE